MPDQNDPRDPTGGRFDWESLPGRLLHPVQVQIIEAMLWIDRPLSPRELELVFEKKARLSTVAYHVRRLVDLEVVVPAGTRQVRGAVQRFYRLRRR
jgi:hypothetical protein